MPVNESIVAQSVPDRNREFEQLEANVAEALRNAREGGADATQVTASESGGLNVTVRLGEVETLEHTRDRGISVTVYRGHSKGSASSADLSPESIDTCVKKALDIALYTEPDPSNGLPEAERQATEFPELDLWHPRPMDANQAIERAMEIEAVGRDDPGITNSEGASTSISHGLAVYGDSNGFVGRSCGTRFGQSCVLIAGDDEGMQRDYWYDSRRDAGDLESAAATGEKARIRTLRRMGARKIDTCTAPVLFAPDIARGVLGHFVGAVSGGALYRDASFLKGAAGEQLFPEWLTLAERPMLKKASGSASFDAEGVATAERQLVEDGVLTGYVLSTYAARRLGLESTGNAGGIHNLLVSGQMTPFQELLGGIDRGLLVTEVMGQGVSLVTGDYSRGAAGFWIENGELAFPVEEVTVAGNLRDMFRNIEACGDDLDDRGNLQSGSLLIGQMTIAGS